MKPHVRPALRATALAATLAAAMTLAACGPDSPQKLMEKARTSIAARDLKTAEIHVKNLLQQKPDDAEARAMLAGIYAAGRDLKGAEKEWQRALELGLPPDRALPGLLETRVMLGDPKGALEAAGKYTATDPKAKAAAAYWSGRAHAALRQPKDAERAFRDALAADPDFHRAQVMLITLQAGSGDIAGAATAVDALLARAPALPEALILKADLQLARSDAAGAKDSFARAIEADPTGTQARIRLVTLLIETRDLAAAETQLAELKKVAGGQPQTVYLGALLDFRQQRLAAARDGVLAVLKVAPDFLPAVLLAGNVALAQGQLEQAETHARRVVDLAPGALQGQRLLAAVLLQRNDAERAMKIARDAIDGGVRDPAMYAIAGEASLRRNDVAGANRYFEQATRLDPKDAARRTSLGVAQIAAGRTELGFSSLESAVELDPQSTQADLALISARLRAKQYDQALTAIDRLEKKQPGKPLPHNLRGMVRMAQGDVPKARESFERAVQIDPAFFPAVGNLAQLDLREKRPEEARKRLEALVERDPKSVQGWMALAQLAGTGSGTRDDVAKVLERARAANPDSVEPVLGLARLRIQANQPRDAIPLLQASLARNPDDRALLDALGTAFLRNDEKQQALDTFEKLVRLDARNPAMHMRMGELKASLGDTAGALASFRQAAELDPKAPGPQIGIAAMLLKDGKKDEARRVASALQKDLPASPAGLALEGDLYAADGRWADAAASYRKALAVERGTPLVVKLHQALLRAERAPDAEAVLREALKAAPADLPLRLYAGERAVGAQQWAAAVEHYDVVVRAAPGNVVALNNLAWSLKELKDPRAVKVAEDALARAPKAPAVMDTLGVILSEQGDSKRALELLKEASTLAPKAPQLRLHYAQALLRAGDKAGARTEAEAIARDFPDTPSAKAARELAGSL